MTRTYRSDTRKFALRRKDGWGAGKDTIWLLDENYNYIDALIGMLDYKQQNYKLAHRVNGSIVPISDDLVSIHRVNVPLSEVKCKYESQERALRAEGLIK